MSVLACLIPFYKHSLIFAHQFRRDHFSPLYFTPHYCPNLLPLILFFVYFGHLPIKRIGSFSKVSIKVAVLWMIKRLKMYTPCPTHPRKSLNVTKDPPRWPCENLHIHKYVYMYICIQWSLSIADMLYSGHLSIADTFPKNEWNHDQSLIEKPFYTGHHFWKPMAVLYWHWPLYSGQPLLIKIYYKVAMFLY